MSGGERALADFHPENPDTRADVHAFGAALENRIFQATLPSQLLGMVGSEHFKTAAPTSL